MFAHFTIYSDSTDIVSSRNGMRTNQYISIHNVIASRKACVTSRLHERSARICIEDKSRGERTIVKV